MKDSVMGNKNWAQNNIPAWGHNEVPPQSYSCVAQHMMETINPPKLDIGKSPLREENQKSIKEDNQTIIGFKTIRFLSGAEDDDESLVKFVMENFPCSKIVINYSSNITRQSKSAWWSKTEQNSSIARLDKSNARLRKIGKLFGSKAFMLDSAIWLKNLSALNEMVTWLGFSEKCHFTSLLAFNVGGGGYKHGVITMAIQKDCHGLN